jgi:hypothetical protein
MIGLAQLAILARLANAAYAGTEAQAAAGAAALGMSEAHLVQGQDCAAIVCRSGARRLVAFAGTHVTANTSLAEIADNFAGEPIEYNGGRVHDGYFAPLDRLWPRIGALLGDADPVVVLGHSMGGARAHLARSLLAQEREVAVVSFGAPKAATPDFWRSIYGGGAPLRVVFECDFAPTWPELGPFAQPGPMLWLRGATATMADARPGIEASVADHAIESYIAALDSLLAAGMVISTAA